MTTTRRDFLTTAVTAAGAAVTPDLAHTQEHVHDHNHDHQVVPSDLALRVKALESLLVEKGLVDRAALDALIDTYEHKVGRAMARASWLRPGWILPTSSDCWRTVPRLSPNSDTRASRARA